MVLDEATLRDLYVRRRLPIREIADRLGCSISTVARAVNRWDLPHRRPVRPLLLSNAAELRDLYLTQQFSLRAIAELNECTVHAVRLALARHQIPCRPSGGTAPSPVSAAVAAQIHQRHRAGSSVRVIANDLGLTPHSVRRVVDEAGTSRAEGVTDAQVGAAYDAGVTVHQLADRYDMSVWTVRHALARAGTILRPGGSPRGTTPTRRGAR